MPKRSFDIGVADTPGDCTMPADKVQRKTERSHEENQERAYVAASRRADRSIEARVQSARMASEIHKKRTGKGFRITEEIVMREEMYEEEDDDLPRSYRLLGPQLQTASQDMNLRVEEYLNNTLAMRSFLAGNSQQWRENEINKLFDQSFPNAQRQAQQLSQHLPGHYPMHHGAHGMGSLPQSPAVAPNFPPVNYHPGPHYHDRSQSIPTSLPTNLPSSLPAGLPVSSPTEFTHRDESQSPYIATPMSGLETMRTRASLSSDGTMAPNTPIDLGSSPSVFTTELPGDAKGLMINPLYDNPDWMNPSMPFDASEIPEPMKMETSQHLFQPMYYQNGVAQPVNLDSLGYASTPIEENWTAFIDEAAWGNDQ